MNKPLIKKLNAAGIRIDPSRSNLAMIFVLDPATEDNVFKALAAVSEFMPEHGRVRFEWSSDVDFEIDNLFIKNPNKLILISNTYDWLITACEISRPFWNGGYVFSLCFQRGFFNPDFYEPLNFGK